MILLFLGNWRSTCIIAVSIPLAIMSSLIGLYLAGQTINLMTLGGLALAIGILVDDATVLGMIRERLAEADVAGGFILDGFPRNIAQAEALDSLLSDLGKPLTAVVQMDVPYAELTRRIAGRRSCQNCGRVFNI